MALSERTNQYTALQTIGDNWVGSGHHTATCNCLIQGKLYKE